MNIIYKIVLTSVITSIVLLGIGCNVSSTTKPASDYTKLCSIYKDIAPSPISPIEKAMQLSERVQKEIPKVYIHYENIIRADPNDQYKLFKQVAETETKEKWDCTVMQDHFSGKFSRQSEELK